MLEKSSGVFLAGNTITLADFAVYAEYRNVDYLNCFDVSGLKNIQKWVKACEGTKGISTVHGNGSLF